MSNETLYRDKETEIERGSGHMASSEVADMLGKLSWTLHWNPATNSMQAKLWPKHCPVGQKNLPSEFYLNPYSKIVKNNKSLFFYI